MFDGFLNGFTIGFVSFVFGALFVKSMLSERSDKDV